MQVARVRAGRRRGRACCAPTSSRPLPRRQSALPETGDEGAGERSNRRELAQNRLSPKMHAAAGQGFG
jgi:hypothetical protein